MRVLGDVTEGDALEVLRQVETSAYLCMSIQVQVLSHRGQLDVVSPSLPTCHAIKKRLNEFNCFAL